MPFLLISFLVIITLITLINANYLFKLISLVEQIIAVNNSCCLKTLLSKVSDYT